MAWQLVSLVPNMPESQLSHVRGVDLFLRFAKRITLKQSPHCFDLMTMTKFAESLTKQHQCRFNFSLEGHSYCVSCLEFHEVRGNLLDIDNVNDVSAKPDRTLAGLPLQLSGVTGVRCHWCHSLPRALVHCVLLDCGGSLGSARGSIAEQLLSFDVFSCKLAAACQSWQRGSMSGISQQTAFSPTC